MAIVDHFRPRWRHSEAKVRLAEVARIVDRGTLETIIESPAPTDVRRIAAERLFSDAHVRSHARRSVREAAVGVIEDASLLTALAELDSEPEIRVLALHRLGRPGATRVCPLCGEVCLSERERCGCGFDLQNGDLSAANDACERARARGKRLAASGLVLMGLGLLGGMTLLPVHLTVSFVTAGHRVDLLFLGGGLVLFRRGRRSQRRPLARRASRLTQC